MKVEVKEIKRIRVLTLAKIFALLGAIIGLIYGVLGVIQYMTNPVSFSLVLQGIQTGANTPSDLIIALGWLGLIILPIVFAIFQWIYGAIIALIYNLFSKLVGGIKVELA